jgi:hypothetical protein
MEAAKVALHYATPDHAKLLPILESAAEHWKVHEEPYPTKGGAVPSSPREKVAEASAAISPPDYDKLKVYTADSRWDVREVGVKMLIARLGEQAELASAFLADIEEGKVASNVLDKALTAGVLWDEAALTRVEQLLASPRIGLRYAAMALLKERYLSLATIRGHATILTTDEDRQVRDRAFRILDEIPRPKR